MRYRGGGIGHLYMRETEQQLNSSGWGSSWPSSLRDRDPNPDPVQSPQNNNTAATTSAANRGYKSDSTEEDIGDDGDSDDSGNRSDGELIEQDGDGEDPEQAGGDGDEEEDEDEDADISGTRIHLMERIHRAKRATRGSDEDEIGENEEDFDGDMGDFEEDEEDIGRKVYGALQCSPSDVA